MDIIRKLITTTTTFILIAFLYSCSQTNKISKQATTFLFSDSAIKASHIGISIYSTAKNKLLYTHNADKYFTPASNTKLFTLYAGMKYLGDSLTGLKYFVSNDSLYVLPTGDPTLLHPYFAYQPVISFFKTNQLPITCIENNFKTEKYGRGWAWDDCNETFMPERSALPVFGNLIKITAVNNSVATFPNIPKAKVILSTDSSIVNPVIKRSLVDNIFTVVLSNKKDSIEKEIPFTTNGIETAVNILHQDFPLIGSIKKENNLISRRYKIIKSAATDSLFKNMMHRSDNFFAEQTLLMASNEQLGYMNETDLIDTLLKSDLKNIPQKIQWVDGSGLSRYNLFTPSSFVYILDKMKNEFGMERLKIILPTGGEGTLKNYYLNDRTFIYAKTGSLSNNNSLSGFLITKKGELLIFSILVNNYITGATPVRKAIEQFLESVRNDN